MKSKNIKIKRRKYSLYSRKKSKGKQALAIILTIVIAVALCVIGFGLGRPLMEYFNGEKTPSDSSSGWTPPVETVETSAPTTEATVETDTAESTEPSAPVTEVVYTIPAGALRSAESLKSAVASAKAEGCTTVLITMKNSTGNYLYKTERTVFHYGNIITGTLTAKEICDIITAEGLVPCARISTLKDKLSGNYLEGIKYYNTDGSGWLDAAYSNGGKAWLDPFSQDTAEYVSSIVTELTSAGFKEIVLADTMYPVFRNVDLNTYLSNQPQLAEPGARLDALWDVVNACGTAAENGGAKLLLEVNAADMDAADKTATTAEITSDKQRLKSVELLIAYTPASGSEYAGAKSFTGKLTSQYSGQSYSVLIVKNAVSESGYEQLLKAFSESGITVFSE